ncbi:hypothetical protein B0H13DRAFT_2330086 [Mycena leptocephala]|nr:hypothetical protein B0H13DRAFT_2330086 [Mycena leptocephala]
MPGARECITRYCMRLRIRIAAFWGPAHSLAPALPRCVYLPPPPPPKSLPIESVFSTEPSTQCRSAHPRRCKIHLPKQSMRAAVDMPSALLCPSLYILAGPHVLMATSN